MSHSVFKAKPLALAVFLSIAANTAISADLGYDMVSDSLDNPLSYSTTLGNSSYSSSGDAFQKLQRPGSMPFALADDSAGSYTSDTLGIIGTNDTAVLFGVVDTVNGDGFGVPTATWTFDISESTTNFLSISIDMAAMGDFETSDTLTWKASIDGNTAITLFELVVDESGSQNYTLESGTSVTANDPLTVDGQSLSNVFQTLTATIEGSGNTLTLTLEANADGGSEAVAFRNIVVSEAESGGDSVGDNPSDEITKIHDIQGSGSTTSMSGQTVTVQGIVVGDFQNDDGEFGELEGFFVQEESTDADGNASTSEGIFVLDTGVSTDVSEGDLVTVTGTAGEQYGQTYINASSVSVDASGQPLPTATDINLPVASLDDFEAFEGMLVRFPQSLQISEYYNFDRYGEIVLAKPLDGESRAMTPTAMEEPGTQAYQDRLNANALSRITLDDARTDQNPSFARHPNGNEFTLNNKFRGGDTVTNVTGVLSYGFSLYRIQPTQGANHTEANPRPSVPSVNGSLKVASFNVLNYFKTLDEGSNVCGPSNLECRGADNSTEFTRQRDKIIAAISSLNADIVGLIEIENDASAAVSDLVNGLNAVMGANTYAFVNTGTIGDDAIKVAFIYKPAAVELVGNFAVLDDSVDSNFNDNKNRPALAQTFREKSSGEDVTVAVNHLKSKGSDCDALGDPDNNDGQGNCNLTRTAAANALASWLATKPTGTGDDDVLLIGDLNAYDKEDPIDALISAGYTDLVRRDLGEEAYTYVFSGQFGYLDYAMSNMSLTSQVGSVNVWHINADEPDILDYDTSYKKDEQDALYEANAYRSSDHDPVIIGLNLSGGASATDPMETVSATFSNEVSNGTLTGFRSNPGYLTMTERYLTAAQTQFDAGNTWLGCRYLNVVKMMSDGSGFDWVVTNGSSSFSADLQAAIGHHCE